jgi:N6-L-threonylcarbamoyladenine synthase
LIILAVETSCDDTAVALLDGTSAIAERVRSQEIHSSHGGVVPELASRDHMRVLSRLVGEVLSESGTAGLDKVDLFAATAGPGLVGSLLVGLSWTKAAAWATGRPFLGINHLAAHLFIHYGEDISFPAVALLVSGGHTSLFRMGSWQEIELLGSTRDDAAGEAFDKTAKIMGLGYPGGALLDRIAEKGDPDAVPLPRPMPDPSVPEFSFSGLKTAARMAWESGAGQADLAASFRKTIVEVLISKLMFQARSLNAGSVIVAGGVSANSLLRSELEKHVSREGLGLFCPDPSHATDNALMVGRAAAAAADFRKDIRSGLSCNAFARWSGNLLSPAVLPVTGTF